MTRAESILLCGQKWLEVVVRGPKRSAVGRSSGHRAKLDNLREVVVKVGILAILDHIFGPGHAKSGVGLIGANESTGQLSGEGRREGSSEDTRRVSRGPERVWQSVLRDQHDRRIGADLSHEGLDGN